MQFLDMIVSSEPFSERKFGKILTSLSHRKIHGWRRTLNRPTSGWGLSRGSSRAALRLIAAMRHRVANGIRDSESGGWRKKSTGSSESINAKPQKIRDRRNRRDCHRSSDLSPSFVRRLGSLAADCGSYRGASRQSGSAHAVRTNRFFRNFYVDKIIF